MLKQLKDFEELLPASVIIRIHHSYIINKNLVKKYIKGEGGQVVIKNGVALDVPRRKKEEFLKAIGQYKLSSSGSEVNNLFKKDPLDLQRGEICVIFPIEFSLTRGKNLISKNHFN